MLWTGSCGSKDSVFGVHTVAMRTIRPIALGALIALAGCSANESAATLVPAVGVKSAAQVEVPPVKFTAEEYGVAASPRLTLAASNLPKGGGHRKVGKPYKIRGKWYTPKEQPDYDRVGRASWYGPNFHGRKTANGEVFDQNHLSAAHPTFPLPSYARVTNQANGKSIVVRVNDRGPYSSSRIIDLSKRTAEALAFKRAGTATVRVEYLGQAPLVGDDNPQLAATYSEDGRSKRQRQFIAALKRPSTTLAYAAD